jgi:hypothetical protein
MAWIAPLDIERKWGEKVPEDEWCYPNQRGGWLRGVDVHVRYFNYKVILCPGNVRKYKMDNFCFFVLFRVTRSYRRRLPWDTRMPPPAQKYAPPSPETQWYKIDGVPDIKSSRTPFLMQSWLLTHQPLFYILKQYHERGNRDLQDTILHKKDKTLQQQHNTSFPEQRWSLRHWSRSGHATDPWYFDINKSLPETQWIRLLLFAE